MEIVGWIVYAFVIIAGGLLYREMVRMRKFYKRFEKSRLAVTEAMHDQIVYGTSFLSMNDHGGLTRLDPTMVKVMTGATLEEVDRGAGHGQ